MPAMNRLAPDIASSLRRFRRYGRPNLEAGQVFDFGAFDHDGNPKEPWEAEFDLDVRGVASVEQVPSRRPRRKP